MIVARERPELAGDSSPMFAELDIDRGNPGADLVGLFVHLGELVHPGRTNHINLREKLAGTSAAEFLAYESIRG